MDADTGERDKSGWLMWVRGTWFSPVNQSKPWASASSQTPLGLRTEVPVTSAQLWPMALCVWNRVTGPAARQGCVCSGALDSFRKMTSERRLKRLLCLGLRTGQNEEKQRGRARNVAIGFGLREHPEN